MFFFLSSSILNIHCIVYEHFVHIKQFGNNIQIRSFILKALNLSLYSCQNLSILCVEIEYVIAARFLSPNTLNLSFSFFLLAVAIFKTFNVLLDAHC